MICEESRTVSDRKLSNHSVLFGDDLINSSSKTDSLPSFKLEGDTLLGNQIMDMNIFKNVLLLLLCPHCKQSGLHLTQGTRYGVAVEMLLQCRCGWIHKFWTSNKTDCRSFDVNKRICYSMRRCGKGHAGLKQFLTPMNLPPPLTSANYNKIARKLHKAVKEVAVQSMQGAAEEVCGNNDITDVGVSLDGTWQKRGFTSLNGAVACISIDTGRILDIEITSRCCQLCVTNQNIRH